MPRVDLTVSARLDLDEIVDYVASQNPRAGDRLIDQFTQLFDLLAHQSGVGEDVSQRRAGLRRFTTGNYVVYFESTAKRHSRLPSVSRRSRSREPALIERRASSQPPSIAGNVFARTDRSTADLARSAHLRARLERFALNLPRRGKLGELCSSHSKL